METNGLDYALLSSPAPKKAKYNKIIIVCFVLLLLGGVIALVSWFFTRPSSNNSEVPTNNQKVVIVGAGVVGLTTGITLLDNGYSVTIFADKVSPNTTSDKAAAFWLPFLSEATGPFQEWSRAGYQRWQSLENDPTSGVEPVWLEYLLPGGNWTDWPWWEPFVQNFSYVSSAGYPIPKYGAFRFRTSLIQTYETMPWLERQFEAKGGVIVQRHINNLFDLLKESDRVINCCGLLARYLVNDTEMHPIRGQIVIVQSPENFDRSRIYIDEITPNGLSYIVPRSNGILLGGTDQLDNWNLESSLTDVAGILNRTKSLIPSLSNPQILRTYAGLRPYRSSGVRLELDPSSPPKQKLIHNYGHGGSGWTVSWGCANAVLQLLKD